MGLALFAYGLQLLTGLLFRHLRQRQQTELTTDWGTVWAPRLRAVHGRVGWVLVGLVLLLLCVGIVGTLGHFGSLGHSVHLWAGGSVVLLVLSSATSSLLIGRWPWARSLHLGLNAVLLAALSWVSWTGWVVVQKYLP